MNKEEIQKQLKTMNWMVFIIGVGLLVISNINNLDILQGILLGVGLFFLIYGMSNLIKQHKESK